MIEITYLDASKNERTVTFESYEDFDRSQQACPVSYTHLTLPTICSV